MTNKAIVAQITAVEAIPGADRIQIARVLGESVVVSKDLPVGYVGVLFPVGVALSEAYAKENNLHRRSGLNADISKVGFFEESRRVRAQPFLKVKSEGYFTSLDSLASFGPVDSLKLGEAFDVFNGHKICEKYISEATRAKQVQNGKQKPAKVSETPYFDKHVDSEQFRHFATRIPVGALLSFHAKVHGTSARVARTVVEKPIIGFFAKLANKVFGDGTGKVSSYEMVVGTRNVVLDSPEKQGFHGREAYRYEVADMLKPHLEKGMTIYGEIAGYANGAAIMPPHSVAALKNKAYTKKYGDTTTYRYGCKESEFRFHVYRITRLTHEGVNIDMSQLEMEQWCADRGILSTVEVHPQMVYDGNLEALQALVEELTERPDVLTEDYIDPSHISEGIIIRVDHAKHKPTFFKNKSYPFRVMEGHAEVADPEDAA